MHRNIEKVVVLSIFFITHNQVPLTIYLSLSFINYKTWIYFALQKIIKLMSSHVLFPLPDSLLSKSKGNNYLVFGVDTSDFKI